MTTLGNRLILAAWAATLFGLLEGLGLSISRADPLIQAAHKVSVDILWVAPLAELFLFLGVALVLPLPLRRLGRWLKNRELPAAYGVFVFLGIYTVVTGPRKIEPIGAVILSLGAAVVFCRKLGGSEEALTAYLRRRLLWVPLLIVMAALGSFSYARITEAWKARSLRSAPVGSPNVLVVVLDTVRADRFPPVIGSSLTPNLDRITADGIRFENAWSTTSWSLPSQASILTGRYPHEHGADWPALRLVPDSPTLAESFADRGYATGAFSGNAAWVTPEYLGPGFLRFDVYQLEDLFRRTVHGRKVNRLLEKVGYHSAGRGKKAPTVNAQFLGFLDDYRDRPFFAYLCYMDVNQGFHNRRFNYGDVGHVPAEAELAAYDRALTVLDRQIGALFQELERRGLLDHTLVVITSDHGESFGAQETADHDPSGHGTSLYREQAAVPLFLLYPGQVPAGGRVHSPVSLRQIAPTIADLLGWPDSPFPGPSLPLVSEGENTPSDSSRSVLAELRDLNAATIAQSVIRGHWQYLHHPHETGTLKPGEELYNFAKDPQEKLNQAAERETHKVLIQMREDLEQLMRNSSESTQQIADRNNLKGKITKKHDNRVRSQPDGVLIYSPSRPRDTLFGAGSDNHMCPKRQHDCGQTKELWQRTMAAKRDPSAGGPICTSFHLHGLNPAPASSIPKNPKAGSQPERRDEPCHPPQEGFSPFSVS